MINVEDSSLLLNIDKYFLTRILDNLISNAIKFSSFGKNIYFDSRELIDSVIISIRDEGPGMTADDLKNIYRKYHKLSAKSTAGESSSGLGLYIVKQLVDKIGATIEIDSVVNVGTTFTIKIPKIKD